MQAINMRSLLKAIDFSDESVLYFLSNVKEIANSILLGSFECLKTKNSSFAVPSLLKRPVIVAILIFGAWAGATESKDMEPASGQMSGNIFKHVAAYDDDEIDEDRKVKTSAFRFNADFLYRYHLSERDNDDIKKRVRHRIRARFGIKALIGDDAAVVFQLASGSDDLVSSNQTLTDAFSSKNVTFDLAYAEYKPPIFGKKFTFQAGKVILPFHRPGATELLWDNDLRPEGLTVFVSNRIGSIATKMLGGLYILKERENDDESEMLTGQFVVEYALQDNREPLKFGVGYFHLTGIKDRMPLFGNDFFGNSSYSDGTIERHSFEYRELELFSEVSLQWRGRPIVLIADLVVNTFLKDDDVGWLAGFKYGNLDRRGSWQLRYNYRRVEKDALYGTFTNSNFGDGGTDVKGHLIKFLFALEQNITIRSSYYHNEIGLDKGVTYKSFMLDFSIKIN